MSELFRLHGIIDVDNKEANKSLDETSQKGNDAKSKLSKVFSTVGKGAVVVGKTVATGLAAGGAAMGALTVKALNLGGELEQNMGGSEAVFGEYANKMQATAKSAFENMGLSTSDFLATANKMGALFQGAGFSIEESSGLAADSMQRAADVASIMGIDTESAMEAIAGAAKGNFTMMDNLGVAMNDTTLQAYALEKGISKSTTEMTNQEKIGLAMEMFMEKTAYAAGNYAKENETLAGSLGTAKSALTNFLDGSGSVDQLVSSFSNLAEVVIRNLNELAPRLISGLTDVMNKVMPMILPLMNQVLPVIVDGAISLINGLVALMPSIMQTLMAALPAIIDGMMMIMNSLIAAFPQIMEVFVAALPTLIPQLIDGLVSMIVTLVSNFSQIIQPIIDYMPEIIVAIVTALIENLPALLEAGVQLLMGILEGMVSGVNKIPEVIGGILNTINNVVSNAVNRVKSTVSNVFNSLRTTVTGVWNGIKSAIQNPIESAKNIVKSAIDKIKGFFSFKISWPHIPMPHFGISPSDWKIGDLLKGSIPKLGIDWYAKAMENPIVMNKPTIWGYDTETGQLKGGGEAGTEVVSGAGTLMNMIRAAVSGQNNELASIMMRILEAIISLDENMGGNLREALAGTSFEVNKREFARLVKAVN